MPEVFDPNTVLLILGAAALAPVVADLRPRLRLPVVVVEIAFGILVGPHVLGWAQDTELVGFLSQFGLTFLFFLAGMEIDLPHIWGRPLRLATVGWVLSAAAGFVVALILRELGVVVSGLIAGAALSTTALATIIPILRDAGETHTRFGRYVVAVGAVGEFGPIVMITVLLTEGRGGRGHVVSGALVLAFTALAFLAFLVATRLPDSFWAVVNRTMESSGQLPVRLAVVVMLGLVVLARTFSLDILLGAFAAGVIVGLVANGPQSGEFRSKLDALGYGFFIPIFFVTTGITFDLTAITGSVGGVLRLGLFLLLLLAVRGFPVPVLYRSDLSSRQLLPLALLSATGLPLIVAITTIGVDSGRMRSVTASALVGAGMISVFLFPLLGLRGLKVPRHLAPPVRKLHRRRPSNANEGTVPEQASHQPTSDTQRRWTRRLRRR